MDAAILQEVEDAFAFAEAAPTPLPECAYTDLYSPGHQANSNVMHIERV